MMTTVFEGRTKFGGISDDHVRVAAVEGLVLIRAIDAMEEESVTIAMTPKQARYLVDGILSSVINVEANQ